MERARFERPNAVERLFNLAVGVLPRLGVGPRDLRLLEVRGRKSGRRFALPVTVLAHGGGLYLVAPRGRTEWVRNALATGSVVLRRGRTAESHRVHALADAEKPVILKAYLDANRREVQRFFPVPAGSPAEAFAAVANRYPVLALVPAGAEAR
jgi:deazaflavin-dependent oxidoreductase (nitroreductase family)